MYMNNKRTRVKVAVSLISWEMLVEKRIEIKLERIGCLLNVSSSL